MKFKHIRFVLNFEGNSILKTSYGLLSLKDNLKANKPAGVIDQNVDDYLVYFFLNIIIDGLSLNLYKGLAFTYELKRGKGLQLKTDNKITARSGLVGLQYSF